MHSRASTGLRDLESRKYSWFKFPRKNPCSVRWNFGKGLDTLRREHIRSCHRPFAILILLSKMVHVQAATITPLVIDCVTTCITLPLWHHCWPSTMPYVLLSCIKAPLALREHMCRISMQWVRPWYHLWLPGSVGGWWIHAMGTPMAW